MYYYNPDKRSSRRWAWVATGLYAALLGGAFLFASVDVTGRPPSEVGMLVEFVEPPVQEPPEPPRTAVAEPEHQTVDAEESFNQAKGSDEATRTVNPKAFITLGCIISVLYDVKQGINVFHLISSPETEVFPCRT